ncbi:B12-binding domain-containing protein [Kitasatospora sp. NPDC059571]|uniref:cobalamin B12-binding domain-containing protein n=1 Tax=Kitasatospora sp. NPDC059571 TaxID=3346871 RepID=UPI003684407E
MAPETPAGQHLRPDAAGPGPAGSPANTDWVDHLWQAVAAGDEYAGATVLFDALDAGVAPESVLIDGIAEVQRRVGAAWAADRMTVTQEHAATAVNERLIAAMAHRGPGTTGAPTAPPRPATGRITVACVDGEWHALPARLLAEVLHLRGWRVDYLGAQVPTPHLIAHLHRTGPDAVALSASLVTRLPAAHAAITACRAVGVPVLAGGAGFGPDGRYARLLGADAWAPDARAAADLLADGPPDSPRPVHQPIDDLPHLADQEYTLVTRESRELVRSTLRGMQDRIPAVRGYTDEQHERTAEDIAHIVQFLAAALYTGDARLFADFLTWTVDILTVRGVPAGSVLVVLDLLGDRLAEFPRALDVLACGRDALTTPMPAADTPLAPPSAPSSASPAPELP